MSFTRAKFWVLFLMAATNAMSQQTRFRINYDINNFDFAAKTAESVTNGNYILCGWNTNFIPIVSTITEVNGSGNVIWSKRYSGTGLAFQLNDLRKDTATNQYYACGGTENGDGILLVLNAAGTPLISRRFSLSQADGTFFNRIIKTSDGGYVAVGYVTGYDPDGSGPEIKFSPISYTDNNGDPQTEAIGSPIIVKFDGNGNDLWHWVFRYYTTAARDPADRIYNDASFTDVVEVSDGYIAVGSYDVNNFRSVTNSDGNDATPTDAIFLKTSPSGTIIYHQQIDAPSTSTSQSSKSLNAANKTLAGLPIFAGNDGSGRPCILLRLPNSGGWASPTWIRKYSGGSNILFGHYPFIPNTVFETDDGNYATWTQYLPLPSLTISSALLKVNPNNGNVLFGKQYTVSTFALLPTGQQVSDKGYISLSLAGGLNNFDLQLIKTDSAGNTPSDCPQTDLSPTVETPSYTYAIPHHRRWNTNTPVNNNFTPTVTNINVAPNVICRVVACNPKPPTPTATATPATICSGQSAQITASGGTNVTYRIYTQATGGTPIGQAPLTVSPTVTTTYYVEADDNTNPGCVSATRATVTVTVNQVPDDVGNITGSVNPCPGTQNYSIAPVNGASSYSWAVPAAGGNITAGGNTTNVTINWINSGSYVITVTASNTCGSKQGNLTVNVQNGPPTSIGAISGNFNPCPGSQTYNVPTVPNATNYVWNISGGGSITSSSSNTATINWTTPGGPYTISVTASNGCGSVSQTAQATVQNGAPSIFSPISGNTNPCPGNQSYSITAVPGATTYLWTVSAGGNVTGSLNTATVNWLNAGNYTVSVTASNNCGSTTATLPVTVKAPPPSSVGAISGNINPCPGNQTYSIAPVTGASNYQWSVSNGGAITQGQNTPSIIVNWILPGGVYTVSVVASNDCGSASNTASIIVQNPPPASPSAISGDTLVCVGNKTYSIAPMANASSYVWAVSGGGSVVSGQGSLNPTIQWTTAGNYTISVTATNSCGSSSPATLHVRVTDAPPANLGNISGGNVVCKGIQVYSVNPISGATSYTWTVGSPGNIVNGQGTSSITVNWPKVAGTFPITVVASNVCGNSNVASLNVTVADTTPPPPASISGPTTPCPGTATYSINNISSATGYLWSLSGGGSILSGQNSTSVTIDWATVGGPYILSVFAQNVCGSSVQTNLPVNVLNGSAPVVGNIAGDTVLCPSIKTYSIAPLSDATGYVWNVSGGTIISGQGTTSISVNWTQPGNGTVSVVANGSCSNSLPKTINIIIKPSAPLAPGNISGSQSVCGGVTETYSVPTVPNATQYFWGLSGGGSIVSGQGTNSISVQWGNSSGTYVLSVYAENDCGQSTAQTISVQVQPPAPVLNAAITGDTVLCPRQAVYSIPNITYVTAYNWTLTSGGNILIGQGTTTITVNWNTAGVHSLSVTVGNSCGVSAPATIGVRVHPAPTVPSANAQDAIICEGNSTTLIGSNSLGGNISYHFYDAETGGTFLGASPLVVSPTITTTYYLESINEFGCRHSGTRIPVTVAVIKAPIVVNVSAQSPAVCYGQSTTLTASASQEAAINWWDAPVNGNLLGTGSTFTTAVLTEPTTFYVSADNANGCKSIEARKEISVSIKPLPVISLSSDKEGNRIFLQEKMVFTASPSGYAVYEFFLNGKLVQSGSENTYASSKFNDRDTIVVVAYDNGCKSAADTAIVKVSDFPNAFTPNKDGRNDVFLKNYELVILNRWGQELYRGNEGWDGTYKGAKCSPGTYFYVVELESITDRKSIVKGTVLLVQD